MEALQTLDEVAASQNSVIPPSHLYSFESTYATCRRSDNFRSSGSGCEHCNRDSFYSKPNARDENDVQDRKNFSQKTSPRASPFKVKLSEASVRSLRITRSGKSTEQMQIIWHGLSIMTNPGLLLDLRIWTPERVVFLLQCSGDI
jgi:hypothetical protein